MKKFFSKAKSKLAGALAMATTAVATAISASAESVGLAEYTEEIKTQFTGVAGDVMPLLVGILGVGLGIFALFKGIKLAKRMFGTVSNG